MVKMSSNSLHNRSLSLNKCYPDHPAEKRETGALGQNTLLFYGLFVKSATFIDKIIKCKFFKKF